MWATTWFANSVTAVASNGVQNFGLGAADAGTVVWYDIPPRGTVLILR